MTERDDSTKRARTAYEAFRGGLISGLDADVPRWEDAPNWIRDVAVVAYLQGKLDAPSKTPTREQIAHVIQAKKKGFAIPLDLALEMADSILWLWSHPGEHIPADML